MQNRRTTSKIHQSLAALVLLCLAQSGFAAQTTSTMRIGAQVAGSCAITTTQDIDFGVLIAGTAATYDVTGVIMYACTNGVRGDLALNGGSTSGDVMNRAMQSTAGDQLIYQLYTGKKFSTIFGDGSGASETVRAHPGNGFGKPRTTDIMARITDADLQGVDTGSYLDTITVTFSF